MMLGLGQSLANQANDLFPEENLETAVGGILQSGLQIGSMLCIVPPIVLGRLIS